MFWSLLKERSTSAEDSPKSRTGIWAHISGQVSGLFLENAVFLLQHLQSGILLDRLCRLLVEESSLAAISAVDSTLRICKDFKRGRKVIQFLRAARSLLARSPSIKARSVFTLAFLRSRCASLIGFVLSGSNPSITRFTSSKCSRQLPNPWAPKILETIGNDVIAGNIAFWGLNWPHWVPPGGDVTGARLKTPEPGLLSPWCAQAA